MNRELETKLENINNQVFRYVHTLKYCSFFTIGPNGLQFWLTPFFWSRNPNLSKENSPNPSPNKHKKVIFETGPFSQESTLNIRKFSYVLHNHIKMLLFSQKIIFLCYSDSPIQNL